MPKSPLSFFSLHCQGERESVSQADNLLELFRTHGNRLTLGDILENWRLIGSKYTNRISEIRAMGYIVECIVDKKEPTNNLYELKEPTPIYFDQKRKDQQIMNFGIQL